MPLKLPNVSAIARDNDTLYLGRTDGLIALINPEGPAMPVGFMGVPVKQIVAHGNNLLAFGDNPDSVSQLLAWGNTVPNSEINSQETDVGRLLSPEFYIDGEPSICEITPDVIDRVMSVEILDSDPFDYDHAYVGDRQLLVIALMGTIYTIDLSVKPKDPETFSFNGEALRKVNSLMKSERSSSGNPKVASVDIMDDDFDEQNAKAFEIYDSLIDTALPIRAHHPQSQIYFMKIAVSSGGTPVVISTSGDHHITVHNFYTHECLLDTGWIDPLCYCGTVVGNKVILVGRDADVVVIDIDSMKWETRNLGVDLTVVEARSCDSKIALKTTDNSILLVDPDTLKIIDVILCDGKIAGFDITSRGLFILNCDNIFSAYI